MLIAEKVGVLDKYSFHKQLLKCKKQSKKEHKLVNVHYLILAIEEH